MTSSNGIDSLINKPCFESQWRPSKNTPIEELKKDKKIIDGWVMLETDGGLYLKV